MHYLRQLIVDFFSFNSFEAVIVNYYWWVLFSSCCCAKRMAFQNISSSSYISLHAKPDVLLTTSKITKAKYMKAISLSLNSSLRCATILQERTIFLNDFYS